MSAFVVDKKDVDAILSAVHIPGDRLCWRGTSGTPLDHEYCALDDASMHSVGKMLLAECIASVSYRYPGDAPDELPGPSPMPRPEEYQYEQPRILPTPIQAIKLLRCYIYQSCEHPGWEGSEAKRFCDTATNKLITQVRGYAEAPWGGWGRNHKP
jgi:hypothetical protein